MALVIVVVNKSYNYLSRDQMRLIHVARSVYMRSLRRKKGERWNWQVDLSRSEQRKQVVLKWFLTKTGNIYHGELVENLFPLTKTSDKDSRVAGYS